jgi:predicted SAM-dependent methyltransferase
VEASKELNVKITGTPDGTYLHIWREGTAFETQKSLVFHKEWTNIKFALIPTAASKDINVCDIRRPLRLPTASFDVVYANHVLEHLTPDEARKFVAEVYRVLKPNGLCRVVVPDLETACIEYLKTLDEAWTAPSEESLQRYRWSELELIDQMVREKSGGIMLELLKSGQFDTEYTRYRYGDVFSEFFPPVSPAPGLKEKILSRTPKELIYELLRRVKLILIGGDPRKTGEANKWMYDRLSLKLLLEAQGFQHYSVKNFRDSEIKNWDRYDFDRSNYGDYPLEPSIYVECRKPVQKKGTTFTL